MLADGSMSDQPMVPVLVYGDDHVMVGAGVAPEDWGGASGPALAAAPDN